MFVFTQGSELRSFWKETDSNLLGQTLRADGVPAHRVDTGIVGDVDRLGLQRKMRGIKSEVLKEWLFLLPCQRYKIDRVIGKGICCIELSRGKQPLLSIDWQP